MAAGGQAQTPQEVIDLGNIMRAILRQAAPSRKLMLSQLTEALATGGVGARIPIIQRAIEAQYQAAGRENQTLKENIARSGQSGTVFANQAQAQQNVAASSRLADVGPSIARAMVEGAPQTIASQQNPAIEGLGQASNIRSQLNIQEAEAFIKLMRDIKSSAEGAYGNAGGTALGGG